MVQVTVGWRRQLPRQPVRSILVRGHSDFAQYVSACAIMWVCSTGVTFAYLCTNPEISQRNADKVKVHELRVYMWLNDDTTARPCNRSHPDFGAFDR